MEILTTKPKERILLIDGLRGFSLLGIVLAHIGGWFVAGGVPTVVYQKFQNDLGTNIANYTGGIFIDGKFYELLSHCNYYQDGFHKNEPSFLFKCKIFCQKTPSMNSEPITNLG